MIRIDKKSYLERSEAERSAKVIKSWNLTELSPDDAATMDLKQLLAEYLGEEHEAVGAASAGDTEHPLSEETCEMLLKAFDPRAAVEAEIERAARQAAAKHAPARPASGQGANGSSDEAEALTQRTQHALQSAQYALEEAKREARAIVEQAHKSAGELMDEAAAKSEKMYAAARAEGNAAGIASSQTALLQVREDYEARLSDFFEQVRVYHAERDAEFERSVLTLSLDIAEKILSTELEKDIEPYLNMVQRAVAQLNTKERFLLRLNKREFDRLMGNGDSLLRERLGDAPVSVICDSSLEPGALLLQLDEGSVDAGVKKQLDRLRILFGVAGEPS